MLTKRNHLSQYSAVYSFVSRSWYWCESDAGYSVYLLLLYFLTRDTFPVEVAAIAWGINILSGIINTFGTRAIGAVSKFNCESGAF
jgi:hypothetical protein